MKTLGDFIHVTRGFLSHDVCDQIVTEYCDEGFIRGQHPTGLEQRRLSELNISDQSVINHKNAAHRQELDNLVHSEIANVLKKYPDIIIQSDSGYSLRKMDIGDYYKQHTDQSAQGIGASWKLTASIVLNDDFGGGDFCFFDRELCYTLKKGDCLTFPANFMYPHEVREITSGTRFALVTWFY